MKKSLLSALMIGSVALTGVLAPSLASANILEGGATNVATESYNPNYNYNTNTAVTTQATLPTTGTANYDYNYSQANNSQNTISATNLATNATQTTATATSSTSSAAGEAVVAEAMTHLGAPYVWGAKGPDSFDCSGFTHYVYQAATGREIGGWTVPQESAGTQIPVSQAKAGDLYFWGTPGASYHVALAMGNGQYIQAPAPGQGVSISSVSDFAPDFAVSMN